MGYEQLKAQVGRQIELCIGFERLGGKLKEWEEDKEWNSKRKEINRKESG